MATIIFGEQGVVASYRGLLSLRDEFEGSKSERQHPFLIVEDGYIPVILKGDNPFSNDGLRPWLENQIECRGHWHRRTFIIEELSEIVEVQETSTDSTDCPEIEQSVLVDDSTNVNAPDTEQSEDNDTVSSSDVESNATTVIDSNEDEASSGE